MPTSLPIVLSFFLSPPLSHPSVSPRGSETESVSPTISALCFFFLVVASVRSLASTQRRFLPALRHRHSLSFNRHHANLSLSPSLSPSPSFFHSPLLIKRCESPPSTRAAVGAARFARLRGFRQQRPTKTALTDVRRAPCRRVYTRANYDPLSRKVYEERASCCLPVAAGFTTETRPGGRTPARQVARSRASTEIRFRRNAIYAAL